MTRTWPAMRLSNTIRLLALLAWAICASAQSYTTSFPLTESPISESGKWTSGGAGGSTCGALGTTQCWADVQTNGVMAFGPQGHQIPTPFGDATAVLAGLGPWLPNQNVSWTVKIPGTAPSNCCHETEGRLRTTISSSPSSSITGYEILCQVATGQTYGVQVVRWNGPNGQFVVLGNKNATPRCVNNDVVQASITGTNPSTINVYLNGALYLTVCDNGAASGGSCGGFTYTGPGGAAGPFTSGSPGIGFFDDNGTGADWNTFGISSVTASSSCPSGANYTSPASPLGAAVTLASLGVTTCYYISASGADTNNGLTESSPWAHAPQMPACASSCATVQNVSGGIPAGTGLILRGGDTWHMGVGSGLTPSTGGTWNFHTGQNPQGTATHPIYVGVDKSWFTGGAWVRPVITGDNPLCNASLLSATCIAPADPVTIPQRFFVTSCPFQNGTGENRMFDLSFVGSYYQIDNLELTGMCQNAVGQSSHNDDFFNIGALHSGPITFTNLYVHGFTHVAFAAGNGQPACSTGVCFNAIVFNGSAGSGLPSTNTLLNVIDFLSDSDPVGVGFSIAGSLSNTAYNVITGTSQIIANDFHLFHDNYYCNFYENGHSNLIESNNDAELAGTNAMYNNIFCHLEDIGATGGQMIDLSPPVGTTDYFFNNLMWAVGNVNEIFALGNHHSAGGNTNQGTINTFNNTFQLAHAQSVYSCSDDAAGQGTYPYAEANDHFISDFAAVTSNTSGSGTDGCGSTVHIAPQGNCHIASCSVSSTVVTLLQSNAVASAAGYTSAQTFVFSPTSGSSPTVGTGQNVSFCAALTTASSTDASLTDAAAACGKDTRYACTYNTTPHTVTCPARTAIARPTVRSLGAYELAGGTAATPTFSPGAGSYLSPQTTTVTSSSSGATLCYTIDGTIPTANGAGTCTHGSTLTNGGTVSVTFTLLLQAIASRSGLADSAVGSAQYTFQTATSPLMFAGRVTTHSLCGTKPSTTQLCFAADCNCWWVSMAGAAYVPFGVTSVNGKTGAVVLSVQ